jgi:hemoglobin
MGTEDAQSLYDRLGGVYAIAVVIDDFIDRVMNDARLNANPRVDEAHHRVSPQGFKYYVTEMLCWAAGGPQTYSGRSMVDSHRTLRITADEWDAFMDDLDQSLTQFSVPGPERRGRGDRGEHEARHRDGGPRDGLTPRRMRGRCAGVR